MKNISGYIRSLIALCGLFIFISPQQSCTKGGCNIVPKTSVMELVSLVQYPELRIPNGSVSLNKGGISGIIIVNIGNNTFVAYDRCSPVDVHKRCAVEIESNGLTAIDPCSKARFILNNGAPASIAECPLKPYQAYRQGDNILITN